MKKFLVVLGVCLFAFAFVAGDLLAYNLNYSAEFMRTQSRNASTGVDANIYNPAGLVKIENGLYVNGGNNFALIKYSHEDPIAGDMEADTFSVLTPEFAIVYKQDKWAAYFNMFVLDGGATLEYENAGGLYFASALMADAGLFPGGVGTGVGQGIVQRLESGYGMLAFSLGTAYQLTDMIAVSGGLRGMYYFMDTTIEGLINTGALTPFTLERSETYTGAAGIIGIMVTPIKDLNVALNYQTESVLFGLNDAEGTGPAAAASSKEIDTSIQPAYLAFGVGYKVMPELEVMFSYNLEFTKARSYGNDQGDYINEGQKNAQHFGLGAEYAVNSMIKASAGVLYSTTSDKNAAQNPYSPGLDKIAIGAGASITPMPGLSVDIAVSDNIYLSKEIPELGDSELKKSIIGFAFGVTYKAL